MSSRFLTFAPGSARAGRDHWGAFPELLARLLRSRPSGILAVADRRVLALHPQVARALRASRDPPIELIALPGGERVKTLDAVGRILRAGQTLPRSGLVLAIGGGSIGDVATVAAHLLKRGVELIHVPTTLLAAVDSSVGGKGAVHAPLGGNAGQHEIKNAGGVFHYPLETWLCDDLLASLSDRQLFEGVIEAYKMAACLDARAWAGYRARRPSLQKVIREARALKRAVCATDPYERSDRRRLLNFGHTFGHALESLTDFELSHGEAVCLGILCALDVGRAVGITRPYAAAELEAAFSGLWRAVNPRATPRAALARALSKGSPSELTQLLKADKKVDARGALRMALVTTPGHCKVRVVEEAVWRELLRDRWRHGLQEDEP